MHSPVGSQERRPLLAGCARDGSLDAVHDRVQWEGKRAAGPRGAQRGRPRLVEARAEEAAAKVVELATARRLDGILGAHLLTDLRARRECRSTFAERREAGLPLAWGRLSHAR